MIWYWSKVWAYTKPWKRLNKKKLWNLGTAVNHLEMEEIKSVKLRDNLKIHKRQTGHMVTSIQMMRNLFFAVANIISEHQSICKKILLQTEMVNFIPFTQTSPHELYGYFSDYKTNSRLKLDRLFWQYGVNINAKRFFLIIGKLFEIVFS